VLHLVQEEWRSLVELNAVGVPEGIRSGLVGERHNLGAADVLQPNLWKLCAQNVCHDTRQTNTVRWDVQRRPVVLEGFDARLTRNCHGA
jgi:hypothetical protein